MDCKTGIIFSWILPSSTVADQIKKGSKKRYHKTVKDGNEIAIAIWSSCITMVYMSRILLSHPRAASGPGE